MSAKVLAALLLLPAVARAGEVGDAWAAACAILAEQHGLTCGEVAPPRVERRDDPKAPWGEYVGGNLIYIDDGLEGIDRDWVLVHEMTHYIFSALDVFPLPNHAYIACPSEAVAFAASNAYLESRGYGRQAKTEWIDEYPHCAWMYNSLALSLHRQREVRADGSG